MGNLIIVDCSMVSCEESHHFRLLGARKSQWRMIDHSWDVSVDSDEQSLVLKDRMSLNGADETIHCHSMFF